MSSGPVFTLGMTVQRDRRGLVTANFPYDKVPQNQILTIGAEDVAAFGLIEVGRSSVQRPDGLHTVHVSGEGMNGSFGEIDKAVYEFIPRWESQPIEAHPYLEYLRVTYNGDWDTSSTPPRMKFQPYLTGSPQAAANGLASSATQQQTNPMIGKETFNLLGGIFKQSYVTRVVPLSAFNQINAIVTSLPGGYPTPIGRNWLVMPPSVKDRGDVYEVEQQWDMSPPGGWTPEYLALFQRTS